MSDSQTNKILKELEAFAKLNERVFSQLDKDDMRRELINESFLLGTFAAATQFSIVLHEMMLNYIKEVIKDPKKPRSFYDFAVSHFFPTMAAARSSAVTLEFTEISRVFKCAQAQNDEILSLINKLRQS